MHGQLQGLVDGTRSPSEVDEWACQWVLADDAGVKDPVVWLGLTHLVGASASVGESGLLYGDADYRHWLSRFEEANHANEEAKYLWRVWQEAEVRIRNAINLLPLSPSVPEVEEYLEHNEFGLALETLVDLAATLRREPPDDFWLACSDAAEVMGLVQLRNDLRRRARGC